MGESEAPAKEERGTEDVGSSSPLDLVQKIKELGMFQQGDEEDSCVKRHAFWETQPVAQFKDPEIGGEEGPIDKPLTVSEVREEPYTLPDSFVWDSCDVKDTEVLQEIYDLLANNYVEDDDNMFRFAYPKPFLQWALQPSGYHMDWHIGVRVKASGKLVAFITGIPATICIDGKEKRMAEINFLCIHKKLRSKRLAPVLIKEITRRVNLQDVWQATYTAGTVLPRPIASCRYFHRSLNPKKLIDVGFSRLQPRMTMARTIKLFSLPSQPATPGLRKMRDEDVPQVTTLLSGYLSERFRLHPVLNEDDVQHWLLSRPEVISSYVVENPQSGEVTDLVSFYCLPSTIIGNDKYQVLKAAYLYYYVPNTVSLKQLLSDALILAKANDFDVFNALDIMCNKHPDDVLKELKFGIGDGHLQYYLYNWRVPTQLESSKVGLVLL